MQRAAVIINPRSGRGRGKGLALAKNLEAKPTSLVDVTLLDTFDKLEPTLKRVVANRIETVVISSGDGTIQAVLTWLAQHLPQEKLPRICLLPHGTTNMIAADLGFAGKSIEAQANFVRQTEARQDRKRHTVHVINPAGGKPLHGMFVGTGAVAEATHYTQTAFNDRGLGGNAAAFATLISATFKGMFMAPNLDDPARFDKPFDITLRIEGKTLCQGPQLLMLTTTLQKLPMGARPFWGGATAPLRTTVLPYPVPSVIRWALPLLYGSETRSVPKGAISKSCHSLEIESKTRFVIDGEFFEPPTGEPLRIKAGPEFTFITA